MGKTRAALRETLRPHQAWLSKLRWVDPLELGLALLCALLAAGAALGAMLQAGEAWRLAAGLAHLVFLLAVGAWAPRRLSAPLLGVLCLSLLNYALVLLVGPPQLAAIEGVYAIAAVPALLALVYRLARLGGVWGKICCYREQDDFRWLLTAAPLLLRLSVHRELAALIRRHATLRQEEGQLG